MKKLLGTGNSKLKKTAKHFGVNIRNFSLPAYKSKTGKTICPFADTCVKFCYAQKGAYSWSNVQQALEGRYQASRLPDFVDRMTAEIGNIRKDKQLYIRIHDSGDFYSPAYLEKWLTIAKNSPEVRFYAYTKSHSFFNGLDLPDNFDVILSEGSKLDNKEMTKKRHARIFEDESDIEKAGYVNASHFDLYSTKWFSSSHKIGLVFH